MSRRSPRVRARFAATVQIGGVEHTLICRTRDISSEGCFLETAESIAPGVGVALTVMDNERGEVVCVDGHVTRAVKNPERGVGIRLIDPPIEWAALVERFESEGQGDRPGMRLTILVVSSEDNRRGALALYVTSGWDVRFATNPPTAVEALSGRHLDAVICEFDAQASDWPMIMHVARSRQPRARRLVRCKTRDIELPPSGSDELVHRFIDQENGMEAVLDALTAELGTDVRQATQRSSSVRPEGVLAQVLMAITEVERPLVVFDLDSTLLDNRPRQSKILNEYGVDEGLEILQRSLPEHWTSWSMGEAMARAGLPPELVVLHESPFKEYWRERFFTSEYCEVDEEIDGAADYVAAVREAGARVFYVTGRHEGMRTGTIRCFERHGFPLPNGGDVVLLMKPSLEEDDDDYKFVTQKALAKEGTLVAAFDNEPTHINTYRRGFPDAMAVHLATDHSGRNVALALGVVSIRDFARG